MRRPGATVAGEGGQVELLSGDHPGRVLGRAAPLGIEVSGRQCFAGCPTPGAALAAGGTRGHDWRRCNDSG